MKLAFLKSPKAIDELPEIGMHTEELEKLEMLTLQVVVGSLVVDKKHRPHKTELDPPIRRIIHPTTIDVLDECRNSVSVGLTEKPGPEKLAHTHKHRLHLSRPNKRQGKQQPQQSARASIAAVKTCETNLLPVSPQTLAEVEVTSLYPQQRCPNYEE